MFKSNPKKIPTSAGCYLMKSKSGEVIYVGKAKNLRKRVASYWRSDDPKTVALVAEITDIEYMITDNEVEALILESQLIKKYHPKYNIDLKANQRYAFLKITDEKYPRILVARKLDKKGKFFGPYPSGAARDALLRAAISIFKLRTCKTLPKKACLRYHLGRCMAPCINAVSEHEYTAVMKMAERFLKGDYEILIKEIKRLMHEAAEKQVFEKAKIYRDQLLALEKLQNQSVSRPKGYDQDVVNYIRITHNVERIAPLNHESVNIKKVTRYALRVTRESIIIQLFHFHKGIISGRKEYTFDLDKLGASTPQEAVQDFLQQYYSSHDVPKEVIIPEKLPEQGLLENYLEKISGRKVELTVPIRGLKLKLLEMVKKNLLQKIGENGGLLYELQQVLRLPVLPNIIVCVDISTLSGTNSVGSLVRFVNGQPDKSGYRKFKIKGVVGVDDYAMVKEVVARYAKRIINGEETQPDLFVIDGGRGQLNAAIEGMYAIQNTMKPPLPPLSGGEFVTLAKRLEEIYTTWSPRPLHLPQKSPALQLLRAIRDEAHRFAIKYQKQKRKIV